MNDTRRYLLESVDDAAIVQLYADGFAALDLRDKILVWHLYLAALAGRDIYYDQRYGHNLEMRALLEAILTHGESVDPQILAEVRRYTKLFWINTGPYNNLTARKFVLRLTRDELLDALTAARRAGAMVATRRGESLADLVDRMAPLFFDAAFDPILTNKTPGDGQDILESSSNNLYAGVTMRALAAFEERYALNSRLTAHNGRLVEDVYRVGGRYDREIRRIISHLTAALPYAPSRMADALAALIRFYESGEEADRIAYDIAWVRDQESPVDTINGFIEVYMDPRGVKGAWEGIVCYVNPEKTRRIRTLAAHAQWFEDHMPWEPRFRKAEVTGVTARAIEVVIETGDSGPITPIGINLPNDQAIREQYGSKSVSLTNVADAYERSTPEGMRIEFSWDNAEAERTKQWGAIAQELTTDMHEVIGHGSGRMADEVTVPPHRLLAEQYSAIEEARADLVALYFLADRKLVDLGLVSAEEHDNLVQTEYEYYTRTALVQLRRVRVGTQLEEDHMRNRQLIVHWLRAHTRAIDVRHRDGRTYFVMTDRAAFRDGVGRLLAEVQRIKSQGDYAAARRLFEEHGVHFDPALRDEVVERVDRLKLPSYTGFVMPRLEARRDARGEIVDVELSYPCDLETQMLEYSALTRNAVADLRTSDSDVVEPPARAR
jgi:dipeptidyl-peptidase-3